MAKEGFSITDVIRLFTKGPREALNLDCNFIEEGLDVDLVVIDPKKSWTFKESNIYSKSKNAIALEAELIGMIDLTVYKKNAFGVI